MARKKNQSIKEPKKREKADTEARFPYTTKPSSLRRLLEDIPKKPKPPKFDRAMLKSWGFNDANDHSMVRVLKAVGLLNDSNAPTDLYARFMMLDGGAAALADPIRKLYEPLFHASHAPYKESNDKLQNLFNIHSGGGERTLDQQIQTFKALCDYTSFDSISNTAEKTGNTAAAGGGPLPPSVSLSSNSLAPAVHINVHIHMPENKTRRDYEAIIEDIGRYIFGRVDAGRRDE